jgi:hypothetical protein
VLLPDLYTDYNIDTMLNLEIVIITRVAAIMISLFGFIFQAQGASAKDADPILVKPAGLPQYF